MNKHPPAIQNGDAPLLKPIKIAAFPDILMPYDRFSWYVKTLLTQICVIHLIADKFLWMFNET